MIEYLRGTVVIINDSKEKKQRGNGEAVYYKSFKAIYDKIIEKQSDESDVNKAGRKLFGQIYVIVAGAFAGVVFALVLFGKIIAALLFLLLFFLFIVIMMRINQKLYHYEYEKAELNRLTAIDLTFAEIIGCEACKIGTLKKLACISLFDTSYKKTMDYKVRAVLSKVWIEMIGFGVYLIVFSIGANSAIYNISVLNAILAIFLLFLLQELSNSRVMSEIVDLRPSLYNCVTVRYKKYVLEQEAKSAPMKSEEEKKQASQFCSGNAKTDTTNMS